MDSKFKLFLLACFLCLAVLAGPPGGHDDEPPAMPPTVKVPPSPILSPEEALKSFKLAPGFKIELVAGDPLLHDPVALAFDPDGRIWVVEMRGYMPDTEGKGENEPVGTIAILEDTDGDGRMDKRTEFLDKLVMPRAICLVKGGALIAAPPNLWFCRDTNGDGKCDEKKAMSTAYGGPGNPEHTANGPLYGVDNWIYSANYTNRFRFTNENWVTEKGEGRGQWGLSQDDFGRLFFNGNSDHLRGDLAPAWLTNNPNLRLVSNDPAGKTKGGAKIATDQAVWPIRPNPGINRGYTKGSLKDDGSLKNCTAACGPVIYRGDILPEDCKGNAFSCEPAANLVRREILDSQGLVLKARNPYDKAEFLASTDERFRPVNLYTGPDGALYVCDLYRGVLQHKNFLTGYLKVQIKQRELDKGLGLGRIYRVVHESKPAGKKPQMSKETPAQWVEHLSHPNGWWRDTAQRLLVEKGDASVVPALKALVTGGATPLGRFHALWTLEGLGQLDEATTLAALGDKDPMVRAAAVRVSEPLLKPAVKAGVLDAVVKLAADPSPLVQLQLACSLAEVADPKAKEALTVLAASKDARVSAAAKKAVDPVALKAKPEVKVEKPAED